MKLRFKPQPKTRLAQPRSRRQPGYIIRSFALTPGDLDIIQKCAQEKGLGAKGTSAALRLILRDWKVLEERQRYPLLVAVPPEMLNRQDDTRQDE